MFKIFIPSFIILFILVPGLSYAQEVSVEEIQDIKKEINDLKDEFTKETSVLRNQQNNLIELMEQHKTNSDNSDKGLQQYLGVITNSFWTSSAFGTLIATGLAIIGILVSVGLSAKSVKKEEGTSKKYAAQWLIVGFVIGALFYVFVNSLQTYLNQ